MMMFIIQVRVMLRKVKKLVQQLINLRWDNLSKWNPTTMRETVLVLTNTTVQAWKVIIKEFKLPTHKDNNQIRDWTRMEMFKWVEASMVEKEYKIW